MKITIKTRLHDGIYRSSGGGETCVAATYAAGPRNLLRAIVDLHEIRAGNVRSYGNIGCGSTWLEIDGTRIDRFDLDDVARVDERGDYYIPPTRTEKARALLAEVAAGTYAATRAAINASINAQMNDPNGTYSDADCEPEGLPTLTDDQLRGYVYAQAFNENDYPFMNEG